MRWARSRSRLPNLGVKTVFVLGGPAAVPDTVVDFLKGLNTSCTTDSQCGGVSNTFTNGDPRVAPGTKLTVARIQDPLNDTRYGTMRLLNILTGLPVSIPVRRTQQVQPAMFNATKQVAPASPANVCTLCRTAFVVSGANFPDALSAGVRAYAEGIPMILTDPAALSPEAAQTLQGPSDAAGVHRRWRGSGLGRRRRLAHEGHARRWSGSRRRPCLGC